MKKYYNSIFILGVLALLPLISFAACPPRAIIAILWYHFFMKESGPNLSEMESEHVPTPEEVISVFSELIGKEYTEVRRREDEKGLYLLEVVIPGEVEGENTEYAYMRKGRYDEGQISGTEIHITYFDKDGKPISGTSAARYIDSKWIIL